MNTKLVQLDNSVQDIKDSEMFNLKDHISLSNIQSKQSTSRISPRKTDDFNKEKTPKSSQLQDYYNDHVDNSQKFTSNRKDVTSF